MSKVTEAFYYARKKTLQIVHPKNHGVSTVEYRNMQGKKEARQYCLDNGIVAKF